jgi:hypothetical protein
MISTQYSASAILVGNGTGGTRVANEISADTNLPVILVDEAYSSRAAKSRYFKENPPRGLKRLVPVGLLTPCRPFDDYVAIILAERYLILDA